MQSGVVFDGEGNSQEQHDAPNEGSASLKELDSQAEAHGIR